MRKAYSPSLLRKEVIMKMHQLFSCSVPQVLVRLQCRDEQLQGKHYRCNDDTEKRKLIHGISQPGCCKFQIQQVVQGPLQPLPAVQPSVAPKTPTCCIVLLTCVGLYECLWRCPGPMADAASGNPQRQNSQFAATLPFRHGSDVLSCLNLDQHSLSQ